MASWETPGLRESRMRRLGKVDDVQSQKSTWLSEKVGSHDRDGLGTA